MRPIFAAAIMGGSTILAAGRLPAQQTYEFSTMVELRNGLAAGEARRLEGDAIGFALMAPNEVVEWIEIRDSKRGGNLVATTRRESGRPPSLEVTGAGEVLSQPDGSMGVAIDVVVEFRLNVLGAARLPTGRSLGFVVVGFDRGESAAFPILPGTPSGEEAPGAAITMEQPEDGGLVLTPVPNADESGRVAVARTTPSEPPAPLQGVERSPSPAGPQPGPAARPAGPPAQPALQPPAQPARPGPQPPTQPAGPGPLPPAQPAGPGPPPTAQPTPAQGPAAGGVAGTDWNATATSLRGRNGERFVFQCPPGGTAGRGPWGGEVYADHSSVCTAAVHAGLVTFASGGSVTIEVRAGQDFYAASPGQGGTTSSAAGGWPGSFAFVR
jgi:hypothetical protein